MPYLLQEADSFPAWPRCDRICGLPRFVSIFLALRVTPVFMRPVGRNTSELETGLSQVIGLANLLAVVLHHQASANSSTLSDMRQPSGAVCRLGIPTPAAQSAKTEYPPFRGARQRLLDGSRNLVSFIV